MRSKILVERELLKLHERTALYHKSLRAKQKWIRVTGSIRESADNASSE